MQHLSHLFYCTSIYVKNNLHITNVIATVASAAVTLGDTDAAIKPYPDFLLKLQH